MLRVWEENCCSGNTNTVKRHKTTLEDLCATLKTSGWCAENGVTRVCRTSPKSYIILLQTQICIHLHKRTSPFAVHSLLIERKLAPGLWMTRSRVPPTAGQKPYIGWSFWFWLTATQYMLYCFITRWAATPCKQLPWNHPFRHERACAEQKTARSLAQNPCEKGLQRLIHLVKSIYYRLM